MEQTSSQGNKLFQCLPPRNPFGFPANFFFPKDISAAVGPTFVFAVACLFRVGGTCSGDTLLGALGNTVTPEPSSLRCQQPVLCSGPCLHAPGGRARAGQKVVVLGEPREHVIASTLGVQPAELPWLGSMVFNPSPTGNG